MRRLSKGLKIAGGGAKTKLYSLETEKVKVEEKPSKSLQPLSVSLKAVRLKSDSGAGAGWIAENSGDDSGSDEMSPVSNPSPERVWEKRGLDIDSNVGSLLRIYSHSEEDARRKLEEEKWTKNVVFEAQQLILKAEIEQLQSYKGTKVRNRSYSLDAGKEWKMKRCLSLPAITENLHWTSSMVSLDSPAQKSTSKKHGRLPNQSLESIKTLEPPKRPRSKSNRELQLFEEGSMALLCAAKNNSVTQVSSLVGRGIPTEILDHMGWTPLCIALEHENMKCAEELVRYKANVDFVHEDGTSILHRLTALGLYRGVRFLLRHGVDVDVQDAKGWPAVHYALLGQHLKCAALLFAAGLDLEYYTRARVEEFETVIKIATIGKWKSIWRDKLNIDLDNEEDL